MKIVPKSQQKFTAAVLNGELIPGKLPQQCDPEALKWAPAFDFVTDACYPSVAIGCGVVSNPKENKQGVPYIIEDKDVYYVASGLRLGGAINGACRDWPDLVNSNTYHRSATVINGETTFTVHMYAQYFQKDQVNHGGGGGHTNDLEYVAVWLRNDELFAFTISAHGHTVLWSGKDKDDLVFDSPAKHNVRVIYQKLSDYLPSPGQTHHFRPAKDGEHASNHERQFLIPSNDFMPIVSWALMPQELRDLFNEDDFGSAKAPFNDIYFYKEINDKKRPSEFPPFIPS